MGESESLIPQHGGYRGLKSFQLAQLVYDLTVRFCERYIDRRSRTHDQMVQAARSGVQNIAEGSLASGTSKKSELKLTNVARASLEELRLDYEDFLRQRGLPLWEADAPALKRFRALRCKSVDDVRAWIEAERGRAGDRERTRTDTDEHWTDTDKRGREAGRAERPTPERPTLAPQTPEPQTPEACASEHSPSVPVHESLCSSIPPQPISSSALAANAALSLLNLCCYLLDRQLSAQARSFEMEGGFTERLYRVRSIRRSGR